MQTPKRRRLAAAEFGDGAARDSLALGYSCDGQLDSRRRAVLSLHVKREFFPRQLTLLREKEFPISDWRIDKAFAAVWLSHDELLVGTKCNKLLRVNPEKGTATTVRVPDVNSRFRTSPRVDRSNCGIHSIAISPSHTLVATGGAEPADCAVLSLPNFRHVQTMQGHLDWVFGIAWLTDQHLVTGSRDKSVMLWQVDSERGDINIAPRESRRVHKAKVRDVKYSPEIRRVATISKDGNLRLWDPELNGVRALNLEGPDGMMPEAEGDVICLAVKENVLAVGSGTQVSLVDVRGRGYMNNISLPRGDRGVRSLVFEDDVLSVGTSRGWLSFINLKTMDFMPLDVGDRPADCGTWKLHHKVGTGWLDEYDRSFYNDLLATNAVYSHCWDPSRDRLFVCGGPLAYGLKGCYMGLWW